MFTEANSLEIDAFLRNAPAAVLSLFQVWADELVMENCGTLVHDPNLNNVNQGENLALCAGIPVASIECTSGNLSHLALTSYVIYFMSGLTHFLDVSKLF